MSDAGDLRQLILDAKGDNSFERMATMCGKTPTAKRLQQMTTNDLKAFPDKETIEGLARGTGATITTVVLAAARSLGLSVHSGDDPDALVLSGGRKLRPDQKDAIVAVLRSFQDSNRRAREAAARDRYRFTKEWLESAMSIAQKAADMDYPALGGFLDRADAAIGQLQAVVAEYEAVFGVHALADDDGPELLASAVEAVALLREGIPEEEIGQVRQLPDPERIVEQGEEGGVELDDAAYDSPEKAGDVDEP